MDGSNGIQPVMPLGNTGGGLGSGSEGLWLFALLILFGMGGFGGFGANGRYGYDGFMTDRPATANDVTQASNFAALERQNNEGVAATRQVGYDLQTAIKDANYSTLGEIRDLQAAVAQCNAQSQQCCCNILRSIDSVNYNGAINTAAINANTTAGIQKVLDTIAQDRMAQMQSRINQLELQQAVCGVVRYPMSYTYSAAGTPFSAATCGCNGSY